MRTGRPPTDPMVRLMQHITKNQESGCWEWSGFKNSAGYGMMWIDGKQRRAHKFSLEKKLGRVLVESEVTRHMCNNPPCCNPDHLEVGSQRDNIQDMVRAGRSSTGEKNGTSKLTSIQVNEIRALKSIHTAREIGEMYGIHPVHVFRIVSGKTRSYD